MLRSRLSKMVAALAIVGLGLWVAINLAIAQVPGQPLPQPPGGGNSVHYHYYGGGYQPGYAAPAYAAPAYGSSGFTNPAAARGQYNLQTAQAAQPCLPHVVNPSKTTTSRSQATTRTKRSMTPTRRNREPSILP